eukprot:6199525-Pleurochrysis_carterae.AAC.5
MLVASLVGMSVYWLTVLRFTAPQVLLLVPRHGALRSVVSVVECIRNHSVKVVKFSTYVGIARSASWNKLLQVRPCCTVEGMANTSLFVID